MKRRIAATLIGLALIGTGPGWVMAYDPPVSDAESIALLHAYYPGYWWDHTQLTVAVKAARNVDPTMIAAAREAIAIWDDALNSYLGFIDLVDVTGKNKAAQKADIVIHYIPKAGGVVFGGIALCGAHDCNNVIVRSDLPPSLGLDPYSPEHLRNVTLHELGHALGLGHAEPLVQTSDLMGYGWGPGDNPLPSVCNLEALKVVFGWYYEGVAPYGSDIASVDC